jgi:hypothetical protein
MNAAPVHRWLAQLTFRNAIAVPMHSAGEGDARVVTKGKSAMTKSMEKVFRRNRCKPVNIMVRRISA